MKQEGQEWIGPNDPRVRSKEDWASHPGEDPVTGEGLGADGIKNGFIFGNEVFPDSTRAYDHYRPIITNSAKN